MFVYFSLMGGITINDEKVVSNYIVKNLTTSYVSDIITSELGYYNINLTNFKGVVFNEDDLISIEFFVRYNGIDYKSNIYFIVKNNVELLVKDVKLQSNWNYTSEIHKTISDNLVNVNFITDYYTNILFRLYVKYNDEYRLLDYIILNNQSISLTFNSTGEYKIAGYVIYNDLLLSYCESEFNIDTVLDHNFVRYIEWE